MGVREGRHREVIPIPEAGGAGDRRRLPCSPKMQRAAGRDPDDDDANDDNEDDDEGP